MVENPRTYHIVKYPAGGGLWGFGYLLEDEEEWPYGYYLTRWGARREAVRRLRRTQEGKPEKEIVGIVTLEAIRDAHDGKPHVA